MKMNEHEEDGVPQAPLSEGDQRFIRHEMAMLAAEERVGYPGDAIFDKGYIGFCQMMKYDG